jgi:PA14 domain/Bacterial TSP3 repeat
LLISHFSKTTTLALSPMMNFSRILRCSVLFLTTAQVVSAQASLTIAPSSFLLERWDGIAKYSVDDLVSHPNFYSTADSSSLIAPSDAKFSLKFFGARLRGYIEPKVTGDYTFWISARNGAALHLSDDLAKGKYAKRVIASIDPKTGGGSGIGSGEGNLWDQFSTQRSKSIRLEAGKKYYTEVLLQNGHLKGAHATIAWACNDGVRTVLPNDVVFSYINTTDDADDDFLPNAWESQYGLSVTDNGATDTLRQGERGDFDSDGLSNREEYLLGTNPALADTDGDGASDFDEVKNYGTIPTKSDALKGELVATPELTSYNQSNTSGTWQMLNGGLIGSSFRGRIEWSFTVPRDGWWVIGLQGGLIGTLRTQEDLELGIKVDGTSLAPQQLRIINGLPTSTRLVSPFLRAGTHTFEVDVRNDMGRRTFQILSLQVESPAGFDGNQNGLPDWVDDSLLRGNQLAPVPSESPVSPLCVEGSVRYLGAASILAAGQTVNVARGLGDRHWYANVPLLESSQTPVSVTLENASQTLMVNWTRWNAMAGQELVIRVGDSVKIGGWLNLGDAGQVSITVAGITRSIAAASSFVQGFAQAGNYPVSVTHANGTRTSAMIRVMSADFGEIPIFYSEIPAWRSFAGVPSLLKITAAPELLIDRAVAEGAGQKTFLRAMTDGTHTLAARCPSGAIVSLGSVTSVGVADTVKNDAATYIGSTADGYRIMRSPIVVTGLPVGGRVVITIFRAGVKFMDGTSVKTLTLADFVDGVAWIDFHYPAKLGGGYCHYMDVYDAQNRHLGRR